MRELRVQIRFVRPCLGNVRDRRNGRFLLPRAPDGRLIFLAHWHRLNLRLAAKVLGRYQAEVEAVLWDTAIEVELRTDRWFRCYGSSEHGQRRFALHEMICAGQVVGLNCAVAAALGDDAVLDLLNVAGRYKGLSPWKPGEYGQFVVTALQPRPQRHLLVAGC